MSTLRSAAAPWLTVIMPTHQGERWIDASLQSIAAEAAEGIDVILIDSSPTSATIDIARMCSDRLHLRIIERADLLAWQAKTNFGVTIANSTHICWLHQDDVWLPGRAAAIRAWIEAAPEAVLHLAPSTIIDHEGRRLGTWHCPLPTVGALRSDLIVERLLVQNFISAPAPVFRKDAWLASGGLDETLWYTADWDVWLKQAADGSVYYHDEITTSFRIHGTSLTAIGSRDAADFVSQMRIVLDRHLPRIADRRSSVEPVARASIAVNTALAAVATGDLSGLFPAACKVLGLGPSGIHCYLRDSRIKDRFIPRMRAKLKGAF